MSTWGWGLYHLSHLVKATGPCPGHPQPPGHCWPPVHGHAGYVHVPLQSPLGSLAYLWLLPNEPRSAEQMPPNLAPHLQRTPLSWEDSLGPETWGIIFRAHCFLPSRSIFRAHFLSYSKRGTAPRKGWWRETGCGWPRGGGAGAWKFHYFLSILIASYHHPAPS